MTTLMSLTELRAAKGMSPVGEQTSVSIKKADAALQVVWGEVYVPNVPDSQGDFMTVDDIRRMMWGFMKADRLKAIDSDHSLIDNGCHTVECFQARDGDPDFIPGSWVMGVWCPDDVWGKVMKGDLNGFSLDGIGFRVETTLDMEIPEELRGETTVVEGHAHTYYVRFADDGTYLGGMTGPGGPDGHTHRIVKGAATEMTDGHNHRFSYVEGLIDASRPG